MGLAQSLEVLHRMRVGVAIGVPAHRQMAKGALDLRARGAGLEAEQFVSVVHLQGVVGQGRQAVSLTERRRLKKRQRPSRPRKEKRPDLGTGPFFSDLARPEGFEPPTPWFVARYSIQMSYGRVADIV